MDNKKSFIYDLVDPVEVTKDGQLIEAASIEVYAPRNNVYRFFNCIDIEFNKSRKGAELHSSEMLRNIDQASLGLIRDMGRPDEIKEAEAAPIDFVNQMLKNNADIEKCYEMLGKILCTNNNPRRYNCIIDNVPMKQTHYDDLSMIDVKNILGLYIKSFLDSNQST